MAQSFNFKDLFPFCVLLKDNGDSAPTYNYSRILEIQRRNLQTLAEAQQIGFRSLQSIATRQAEMFAQIMKEQRSVTSEILAEGASEDALARNAALFKKSYEKTVESMNEIGEIVRRSNTETTGVLNRRLQANLKEMKSVIDNAEDDDGKRAA